MYITMSIAAETEGEYFMKAKEICALFEEIAPIEIGLQSDRDRRVLGFRFGNPEINVTGVGIAWYLAMEVIEQAIRSNLNLLLIHEPGLFYDNSSPWHTCILQETNPVNLRKKQLLIDNDICVYTAHSNWDLQRSVGMQPTFARALGLTDEIKRDIAVGIYRVQTMSFSDLIDKVKVATGLKHMRVQGDPGKPITVVAVGFGNMGFVTDGITANNADAGIFGELGEFSFIAAREAGLAIIETTHLVSESIGFHSVVDVMKEKLPNTKIEFLEVPFAYKWV
jgi:putative NIF3 family GTP cyclohydrolase 1 type 2